MNVMKEHSLTELIKCQEGREKCEAKNPPDKLNRSVALSEEMKTRVTKESNHFWDRRAT